GSLATDPRYVKKCRELVTELDLKSTFEFGGLHNQAADIYNTGDISILSRHSSVGLSFKLASNVLWGFFASYRINCLGNRIDAPLK
ncbi:MAG: hypothetical protein ACFFDT_15500, partial [Candidatus Hodarchaeota archaeon]